MGKLMPLEWYLTASEYLKEEGLVKSWSDPCCWLWKPKGILRGIIAGHVGDFLYCGNPKDPEWLAPEKRIQTRFKWDEWDSLSVGFRSRNRLTVHTVYPNNNTWIR